jgi:hypothetical protein
MHEVPELTAWDALPEDTCVALARGVRAPGFSFARVERFAQGGAERWVALYRFEDGAEFALVPGGQLTLGYDPARPPVLDAAGLASWSGSMQDFGMPPFPEYLGAVLVPARRVVLAPLLVETVARPVDVVLAASADDEDDDRDIQERVVAALASSGLRLPTADEWEHACAGGSRTPWRWGDRCPSDEEPYGAISFPELRRRNTLGLAIAQNPYEWEYVAEPRQMRGGDGGEALCGGYGAVACWLACASAYRWPLFDDDSYLDEGFVRRVAALG